MAQFIIIKEWDSDETTIINVDKITHVTDVKEGTLYRGNTPIKTTYFSIQLINKRFVVSGDDYNKIVKQLFNN